MFQVKMFTFNPVQENTYVLWNENLDAIIIDPGCYTPAEERALFDLISQHKLRPVKLINTHCHLDHVFGNKWVAETFDLPLQLHADEAAVLGRAPATAMMWGLGIKQFSGKMEYLKEGDVISLGEDRLEVIEAPGHSPGHLCFYCRAQNFIIGGDVLFFGSIGRTDLPGGNHSQLINNIKNKLLVLPPETRVYPGHGQETTIGNEKKHNPFLQD